MAKRWVTCLSVMRNSRARALLHSVSIYCSLRFVRSLLAFRPALLISWRMRIMVELSIFLSGNYFGRALLNTGQYITASSRWEKMANHVKF